MQTAGICAFMAKAEGGKLNYCTNYGNISCPSGRTGGIVATLMYGNIYNCDNRGTIEDDKVGQHEGKEASVTYNYKRMGGIVGGTDDLKTKPEYTVESCTNYGNVMTHLSVRTGGIIGHSNIQIIGCVNKGAVLGDVFTEGNGTNRHGRAGYVVILVLPLQPGPIARLVYVEAMSVITASIRTILLLHQMPLTRMHFVMQTKISILVLISKRHKI